MLWLKSSALWYETFCSTSYWNKASGTSKPWLARGFDPKRGVEAEKVWTVVATVTKSISMATDNHDKLQINILGQLDENINYKEILCEREQSLRNFSNCMAKYGFSN